LQSLFLLFSWGAQGNNEEKDINGVLTTPLPCFLFHCLKINDDNHKEASSIPFPPTWLLMMKQVGQLGSQAPSDGGDPHCCRLMVLSKKKRK
jgi:hypothetical protein